MVIATATAAIAAAVFTAAEGSAATDVDAVTLD